MNDKELEVLHNKHATSLRQEYNRFETEMKTRLNGLDDRIREIVMQELQIHVENFNTVITNIERKLNNHFGK